MVKGEGWADAAASSWGSGVDVVVMAGNLLINIESGLDYAVVQQLFIRSAARALRPGGHLYLDFDLLYEPAAWFHSLKESSYFTGTDELGTTGRTISHGSVYDPATQIATGAGHRELTTNGGDQIIVQKRWYKHIPTLAQVYVWLRDAGFNIERTYHNYSAEAIPEPIVEETVQATIWACKP